MNQRRAIIISVIAAVMLVSVVTMVLQRPIPPRSEKVEPPRAAPVPAVSIAPTPPQTNASLAATDAGAPTAKFDEPEVANKIKNIARQSGKAPKVKPPIQDPDARLALSLVGADPEAEQYWLAAINDPSLPANERKDLIEDLNEDGLSDPKHPGPQDLPLIFNRIQLIEQVGPLAMDQVNADAFYEAYKDLLNLAAGKSPQ